MKLGKIFIISGPSGVGKTTIRRRVLEKMNELVFSISYTTRIKRKGEVEGKDYFYISEEEFKKKIDSGFFAEWAKVHNHYYGTSKEFLNNCIQEGKSCLLDIDVQGCIQVKKSFPDAVSFFILPPDFDALIKRLKKRNTETEEDFQMRINNAKKELEYKDQYDYVIINDNIEHAVDKLLNLIKKLINE